MNAQSKGSRDPDGKRFAFWRSSVYDEPVWVSLAWIVGPILGAAIAIYFVVT
jgi:hypothetical protein